MRWKSCLTFSNWAIARSLKQLLALLVALIWIFSLTVLPVSAQEQQGKNSQFPLLSPPNDQQTESKPVTPPLPNQQEPQDPQEIEASIDKFFTEEIPKEHVPGSVVALVKDEKTLFTKVDCPARLRVVGLET
ncbi:MAG: hypothetical protein KME12_19995 [Trichocoleus desertorum ATA4-8-CV12]|jgi:hypothetical protein|nr:hypothetical protein [Trichocoleus desertorum ATA4-8-CV12]